MANFQETIRTPGQGLISTLNGEIQIQEGQGRMVIFDPVTQVELVNIDRTGFLFSDGTDRRIKLGSFATRVGLWLSKPGQDVIELLGG
jgi:hypothetical protein